MTTAITAIPVPPGPGPELAIVLRVLDEAPGQLAPPVEAAALILAAEVITAACESCEQCATLPDPCERCASASARAARFRMLAGER